MEAKQKHSLEWQFLRYKTKETYPFEENSNPERFAGLADILEKIPKKEFGKYAPQDEPSPPSTGQLRNFLLGVVNRPDSWLIKYLYFYLFKMSPNAFWEDEKHKKEYEKFKENSLSPAKVQAIREAKEKLDEALRISQEKLRTKEDELKELTSQYNARIETLKKEKDDLGTGLQGLKKENATLVSSKGSIENAKNGLDAKLKEAQGDKNKLETTLGEKETSLRKLESALKTCEANLLAETKKLFQLTPLYSAKIAALSEAEDDLKDLKNVNTTLTSEKESIETERNNLLKEKAGLEKNLGICKRDIEIAKTEIGKLTQRIDEIESSTSEQLEKQKTDLDNKIQELNTKNRELERTIETKQDLVTEKTNTIQKEKEARHLRQKKRADYAKKTLIMVSCLVLISYGVYFYYQKYYAPIVWTVSMPWDGETSSRAEMVRRIAKELESTILRQYNRKFELQIYADGRLPNTKGQAVSSLSELFFAVGRNEIQMAHSSPYYLENTELMAAMFFGSIPGGMNSKTLTGWMTEGDGRKLRDSLYTTQNVMSITCGDTGEQMGGWFKKEIKKITDFNGLRFRIGSPIGKAVLNSFGSDTSNTAISEGQIVRYLAIGNLDGAEWICVYDDYRLGLAGLRDFNFYYISDWHEPALLNDMLINKSAYDALPENIQKDLKATIQNEGHKLYGILHEKQTVDMYLTKIRAKKIKVDSFPKEVESALRLRAIEKVRDFVKENKKKTLLKEIYISYQTYCKNNAPYDCDCKKWKSWEEIVK